MNQAILQDLSRARAVFQIRAITAAIGIKSSDGLVSRASGTPRPHALCSQQGAATPNQASTASEDARQSPEIGNVAKSQGQSLDAEAPVPPRPSDSPSLNPVGKGGK